MIVFTRVWGPYVDLFCDACVPSLLQPGNLPAVERVAWHIYTRGDHPRLGEAVQRIEAAGIRVVVEQVEAPESALLRTVRPNRRRGELFLMAPPDTFFGDGSVRNLVACIGDRQIHLAAAHLRTDSTRPLPQVPMSNAQLVTYAFENLHEDNRLQFCDLERNATRTGGIALRQIGTRLWQCIHHLPTIYLSRFDAEDEQYWKENANAPDNWDHYWPSNLVNRDRFRVVGSSDTFFAIEITGPDKLMPAPTREPGNDTFDRDQPHNRLCHAISVCLRGE